MTTPNLPPETFGPTAEPDEAPQRLRDVAAAEATDAAATGGRTLRGGIIDVALDGGLEYEVQVDNRDYVRWDMTATRQKWPEGSKAPFLFQTFLAWSALKRRGDYAGGFEQFQNDCLFASMRREEEAARPTQ